MLADRAYQPWFVPDIDRYGERGDERKGKGGVDGECGWIGKSFIQISARHSLITPQKYIDMQHLTSYSHCPPQLPHVIFYNAILYPPLRGISALVNQDTFKVLTCYHQSDGWIRPLPNASASNHHFGSGSHPPCLSELARADILSAVPDDLGTPCPKPGPIPQMPRPSEREAVILLMQKQPISLPLIRS